MDRKLTFNLPEEQYEWLRRQAFETRRPMTEILREAIQRMMEGQKSLRKGRGDGTS